MNVIATTKYLEPTDPFKPEAMWRKYMGWVKPKDRISVFFERTNANQKMAIFTYQED